MDSQRITDDPSAEDATRSGRGAFVERVWHVLQQAKATESSTVFALVGPWGSGKSSILAWLEATAQQEQQDPWLFVRFNPWDFPDPESLQFGFFAALHDALGGGKESVAKRIATFSRKVAPLTSLGALWGLDPSKAIAAVAEWIGEGGSAAEARAALETSLRDKRAPILVTIDDLDRVTSEELLATLKLVRQLGRLPNVHYLLAYDETTIVDVLTRTTLVGANSFERAAKFMEKVVQVRFDVPRMRPSDAVAMTSEGLDALTEYLGISLEDGGGASRFSAAYFAFIDEDMRTPRSIRRFLAQAYLVSPVMAGEIDLSDYLVLTWLRAAEPELYRLIQDHRSDLVGRVAGFEQLFSRRDDDADAFNYAWRGYFAQAGIRRTERAGKVLTHLFPRFARRWDAAGALSDTTGSRRLYHEEYFDRYYSLGILEGDIPDATIEEALTDVGRLAGSDSAAFLKLRIAASENPSLVISKLRRQLEDRPSTAPELYVLLGEMHARDANRQELLGTARQAELIVENAIRLHGFEPLRKALISLAEAGHFSLLLASVDGGSESESPAPDDLLSDIGHLLAEHLQRESIRAEAVPVELGAAVWSWHRLHPPSFRMWIRAQAAMYGDLCAVSFSVSRTLRIGGFAVASLIGFDADAAGNYFDLSQLKQQLAAQIESREVVSYGNLHDLPDSPENRRLVVLDALAHMS